MIKGTAFPAYLPVPAHKSQICGKTKITGWKEKQVPKNNNAPPPSLDCTHNYSSNCKVSKMFSSSSYAHCQLYRTIQIYGSYCSATTQLTNWLELAAELGWDIRSASASKWSSSYECARRSKRLTAITSLSSAAVLQKLLEKRFALANDANDRRPLVEWHQQIPKIRATIWDGEKWCEVCNLQWTRKITITVSVWTIVVNVDYFTKPHTMWKIYVHAACCIFILTPTMNLWITTTVLWLINQISS